MKDEAMRPPWEHSHQQKEWLARHAQQARLDDIWRAAQIRVAIERLTLGPVGEE